MPQNSIVVPADRAANVVFLLSKDTPRGKAMEHAGLILAGFTSDTIESHSYRFMDLHGETVFHSHGLAEIDSDQYYPLNGLCKPLYLKHMYQPMSMTTTRVVVVSGAAIVLRQHLATFFPFIKFLSETASINRAVDMDLLKAGFKDMLDFIYNEIPNTRGIGDAEEN